MKELVVYTSQHPPTVLSLFDAAHTTLGNCLGLTAAAAAAASTPATANRRMSIAMTGKKEEMVMPVVFLYYDFKPEVDGPLIMYEPPWC